MQKRLIRKLDLEMFLSRVASHPSPDVNLEQYTISVDAASAMLYLAAYMRDDIVGKRVLDLGCGTGRLALGAAFLGAKEVVGVDIDRVAIETAVRNSQKLNQTGKVQWVVADVGAVCGEFDTVVQNPPFGVQKRRADRKFLAKAMEVGRVVYSLHKGSVEDRALVGRLRTGKTGLVPTVPSPFLERFIEESGGTVTGVYSMVMTIPRMFEFHRERRHAFVVDLYVVEKVG